MLNANLLPDGLGGYRSRAYEHIKMCELGVCANCTLPNCSRAFGRGSNPARNQNQPPLRTNTASPAAYSQQALGPPSIPAAPASPSLTATMASNNQAHQDNASRKVPFFFREENAGFTVKGNFMTLAAKPHLVEEGEWLAHLGQYIP